MEKVTINVKNDLVKSCPMESGNKVIDSINFVDYLKTLSFADAVNEMKKKEQVKKGFLKLSFNEESALRKAVKNNSGKIEFAPRRGYTAVFLIF